MALATWWQGDTLPDLRPLPHFSVRPSTDKQLIAQLAQLSIEEVERRFQVGNHLYLAYIDEEPVAYGWLATQHASIDEIQLSFNVTEKNCYLWDFATLLEWRGKSIYQHFLQDLIRQEVPHIERFWIGYVPDNKAAERAITNAGFQSIADISVVNGKALYSIPLPGNSEMKILACAEFFQLPITPNTEADQTQE
jgi:GNAT superfamily N-acetyltransferase